MVSMQRQAKITPQFSPRRRAQRGQTIVIALLVLLLLAFLGGLFASIVTRNLQNQGRSNQVQTADYYAESGVRFADEQLTYSTDGADWRPPLQYALATPPTDIREADRYNAAVTAQGLAPALPGDPDKVYLDQGFSRYDIGGGRFLIRVSYDPVGLSNADNATADSPYSDPLARYIKIESIGREGTIDPHDPTTYGANVKTRLSATLVQYKAIGITDYARFITNPDKRSDVMSLGVASQYDATTKSIVTPGVYDFSGSATTLNPYPVITTYGAPDAYIPAGTQLVPNPNAGTATAITTGVGGGSIRVNGSARFSGVNYVYLNHTNATGGTFNETMEVAGDLRLDNYDPTKTLTTGQYAALLLNPDPKITPQNQPLAIFATPSNDPNGFDTFQGTIRDGAGGSDANGYPRNVNRLEPPTLDSVNPATNLTRYRAISENATPRLDEATVIGTNPPSYANGSSLYGYGQAIYVDNGTDVQKESSSLVGGYTLIDEWLHRTDAVQSPSSKSGWVANFYRPPGVDIVLGRQVSNIRDSSNNPITFYGVRLTRSDVDGQGNLIGWHLPDGSSIAAKYPTTGEAPDGTTQTTMTVSYKALNASNIQDPTVTGYSASATNFDNDVIIYAEGNIRVRGPVSADPNDLNSATTYAGGTSNNTKGSVNDDDHLPRHVTIVTNGTAYIDGSLLRGNPESTIQVLAHDYVCVNTTQFLAGAAADQNPAGTNPPGADSGDPNLRALDFGASDEVLLQEFCLAGAKPELYISGGPSGPGATAADFDILDSNTGLSLTTGNVPFLNPGVYNGTAAVPFFQTFDTTASNTTGLFRTTFALPAMSPVQSQGYQLAVRRDPGSDPTLNSLDTQDFLLERAAILPMDIRIEAGLFAQTRSFFVIPGDWFNTSSEDNTQAYLNAQGTSRPDVDVTQPDQNRFPFFGQPIDMKIVIDGSVAEAVPADISAQTAWMLKWGWIPQDHGGLVSGTQAESAGHTSAATGTPGIGLQIIYNPLAGYPYVFNSQDLTGSPTVKLSHYMRLDAYGRPLPFAPKLPVCTGLLYAGQNTSDSVLQ